jgi:cob(I)alamin adenosyltransferase
MAPSFTRSGDEGYTGILGSERVPKHHLRIEALGTIDEATAALGIARATSRVPETVELILEIQRGLYRIMAEVAATPENAGRFRTIGQEQITALEEKIQGL